MYHVIGTGLTSILLYFISFFFYRIGYYSLKFHRKLWNSILAAVFLIAALSGILMALQISYKLNIPFVSSVLKWHVEAGIGLGFAGIFHFLWHLSYFRKLLNKQEFSVQSKGFPEQTAKEISLNLFIIGFVSCSVQLLLIREMLNIAGGYELITGIFLASWLIVSAIGVALADKSPLYDVRKINLIFSISPLISLLLLFLLSRLFLVTGESPSFLASMIYTFLILIPFCIASGFSFIKLISIARSGNDFIPGKSFSIETTGGVIAGILIPLLTSGLLNTYRLLLLIILLSVAYVLLTFYIRSHKSKLCAKICIAVLAASIIILNPDILFRQILLPGIKIISSKDTPYGNITIGIYEDEKSIYYNHRLLAYNNDVIEREENIHYAMLQSETPEKVILISGSLDSHLPEILKYPVKKIIYIERDPVLTQSVLSGKYNSSGEIVIENDDAYRYIRNSVESVDVVILLIPPPSTLSLNRYYTTEFFGEVKNRLRPGGIFICSPGPGDNYFNQESLNLYSSINNSLTSVFKYVKPVSGNKLYFVASDKELSLSFCSLTEERNINNIYVSPDYLSDDLVIKRSEEVSLLLNREIQQNSSIFPVGSFHFQSYKFSKNINEKTPAIILMILAFALPALMIKKRNILMYFSASALAGFEIIILLTIQLIAGNMYQLTGLVISGLMTGLAVGAGADIPFFNSITLRLKGIILIVLYLCIGLIYNYILNFENGISIFFVILSAFIPALLTGGIFRELTLRSAASSESSAIYRADLAGSAFGFILISAVTIPVSGIKVSIFILSLMIFAGLLFGTIRNK
jgi:spermidine synthase